MYAVFLKKKIDERY